MPEGIAALFAEWDSKSLFAIALLGAAAFLLFRLQVRRVTRPSGNNAASPADARSGAEQRAAAQRQYDALRAELHERERELIGRIDSKLVLLETLVRDARQEADRLERLLQEQRQPTHDEHRIP